MSSHHIVSSEAAQARIAKWILQATPVDQKTTWTERRLAIKYGEHIYIVGSKQVFQCAHCGHYDPEWTASEVLRFFEEKFGIKPFEIEITCSVAEVST